MNIDEIKQKVMEKLNLAKNWVLDNKLEASVIALFLVMGLFMPGLLSKLMLLGMLAYFAAKLVEKLK